MVKRIGQKLRGAAGASIMMALGILMAVAALSASMLSIAVSAPQAAITQQTQEQAYLAVTSAARLLQDTSFAATVREKLFASTADPKEVRLILTAGDGSDLSILNVKIVWDDTTSQASIKDLKDYYSLPITLPDP